MDLSERVRIVLFRPTRAGNVGAACRAMKNMGLRDLVLVEPPEGLDSREARGLAWGAGDVLEQAREVSTLEEAVAEAHFVVATSSRPGEAAWGPRELGQRVAERPGERVAIVFGPEASGLSEREIGLCHGRVVIPADPAQPSLNLAQAVLLVSWELFLADRDTEATPGEPPATPLAEKAVAADLEVALGELETALLGLGFLDAQNPALGMERLRRLLARAAPTKGEVKMLRGIARQLRWAAGVVARAGAGDR